jgi:hypothetical protein
MNRYALTGFVALVSLSALTLGYGAGPGPLSQVLIPPTKPLVRHVHTACPEVKKDCTTCHKRALTSAWASDRLVPEMAVCAPCHKAAEGANALSSMREGCRACHLVTKAAEKPVRGDYPRPNIRFSHKAHQKSAKCGRCHPKAARYEPISNRLDVVGMRSCLACHENSPCRTCHIVRSDGRMYTDYGGHKLKPPYWLRGESHGVGWAGTHATQAGRDSRYCAACHEEAYCRECHAGARRPRNVHPGDWLSSHGVSTRLDNPNCKGCHRKQSFCLTCHRRSGVAPDSPPKTRPTGGRERYHQGMETTPLMRRAKRDITTCVSCHSESWCVTCHIQQNPHPPDFSRKCRGLAARNRRACAKCHTNNPARFCR